MKRIARSTAMLMLVLCVSAISASASQAAPLFHVESAPATITAEQTTRLVGSTQEGTTECERVTFTGSTSVTTSASQELSASYSGCILFGFIGATINMNGCKYRVGLVEGSSPATATTDIVCPEGKSIVEENGFCRVTYPAQTSLPHLVFTNTGTKTTRDMDASVTISGQTYTASSGCTAPGTFSDGTVSGSITFKADNSSGTQQGLWVE